MRGRASSSTTFTASFGHSRSERKQGVSSRRGEGENEVILVEEEQGERGGKDEERGKERGGRDEEREKGEGMGERRREGGTTVAGSWHWCVC